MPVPIKNTVYKTSCEGCRNIFQFYKWEKCQCSKFSAIECDDDDGGGDSST